MKFGKEISKVHLVFLQLNFMIMYHEKAIDIIADNCQIFGIGSSWGGYSSLLIYNECF